MSHFELNRLNLDEFSSDISQSLNHSDNTLQITLSDFISKKIGGSDSGGAFQFIHALIEFNVIHSKEISLSALNDLCYGSEENQEDKEKEFKDFVNTLSKKNHAVIRLLGAAEKGIDPSRVRDIELILAKLKKLGINVEILLSPHAYSALADKNFTSQGFIKFLKPLSYSIDPEQKTITLYSHSHINIDVIKNLASKLKIPFQDSTIIELAASIDQINARFQSHIEAGIAKELFSEQAEYIRRGYIHTQKINEDNVVNVLAFQNNLSAIGAHKHRGYSVKYVYEQPGYGKNSESHHVNLGKKCNDSEYFVLSTTEISLFNALQKNYKIVLKDLHKYTESLNKNSDLYKVFDVLNTRLEFQAKLYFNHPSKESYNAFINRSEQQINWAAERLKNDFDGKKVLKNIMAAILGFGVIYGIAAGIQYLATEKVGFFSSDNALKVEQLKAELKAAPQPDFCTHNI